MNEPDKAIIQEKTEELFYFFKHDGLFNFKKKIVSGKILACRNFKKETLVQEKNKIVQAIEHQILLCKDTDLGHKLENVVYYELFSHEVRFMSENISIK